MKKAVSALNSVVQLAVNIKEYTFSLMLAFTSARHEIIMKMYNNMMCMSW